MFVVLTSTAVSQTKEKFLSRCLKGVKSQAKEAPKATAVTQEIDSTLYWRIDYQINNWKSTPYRREHQYSYDPNSNCTSYVREELDPSTSKFKFDMNYDANKNLLQTITYAMYTTTWMPSSKRDLTYNSGNNLLSSTVSSWFNNTWNYSNRYVQTYNSAQKCTSYTYENWNNNMWVGSQRQLFTYDANNNQTLKTVETYTNNAWVYNSRTTDTYDANGNNLSNSYEQYINSTWKKDNRSLMTYGAGNTMLTYSYQTGDVNNTWKNEYRDTYTYDIGNNLIYVLEEEWTGSSWVNSLQANLTFVAGNMTELIIEEWNGSAWIKSDRETHTYNSANNPLTDIYQTWSGTAWVNDSKTTYTYDSNGNETTRMLYLWLGNTWKIANFNKDSFDNNSFNYQSVFKYYSTAGGSVSGGDSMNTYYKTVVGLKENAFKATTLIVYPNPGKGVFTLETKENTGKVEVFDLFGKAVYQGKIESLNTKLSLVDVPKGIYIVVVSQGKTRETVKIAIE